MNIVLIGYRCSGKTSVGRLIAEKTAWNFIDTDVLIEEESGCSIEDLVAKKGWEYFRAIEREVIRKVSLQDNLVIATGGGIVMEMENIKNLKENGTLIWLRAAPNNLKKRMEKDISEGTKRPSLTGDDPIEEIRKVLNIRNPLYEASSDHIVDTDELSIIETTDVIIKMVL